MGLHHRRLKGAGRVWVTNLPGGLAAKALLMPRSQGSTQQLLGRRGHLLVLRLARCQSPCTGGLNILTSHEQGWSFTRRNEAPR